jgi:hypothetical protein
MIQSFAFLQSHFLGNQTRGKSFIAGMMERQEYLSKNMMERQEWTWILNGQLGNLPMTSLK